MNNSPWRIVAIIVAVIVIICCLCAVAAAVGVSVFNIQRGTRVPLPTPMESTIEIKPFSTYTPGSGGRPTAPSTPDAAATPGADATAQPSATQATGSSGDLTPAEKTVKTLEEAIVPVNDPIDLAMRLQGKSISDEAVVPGPAPALNEVRKFWLTDSQTNENYQVSATLQGIGEHAYFWVENGVNFSKSDMNNLLNTFDTKIYPKDREFFGSEWTPGIDGDPRLYILYAAKLGGNTAGYFSMVDEISPAIRPDSNAHEMFVMSAQLVGLEESFARSVLAHEFQHMIHWYRDRNEDIWINEGFSELAAFINGYSVGGHDFSFAADPDLQLNDWPSTESDVNATIPHYGAAFLFVNYFYDRFGTEATQALVANQDNGFNAVDRVLADMNATDPLTGQPITANDVFRDWVVASLLQDAKVSDGRYTYSNYPAAPSFSTTENIRNCTDSPQQRDVRQFGTDYIRVSCRGQYTLHIEGTSETNLLPDDPYSGQYAWWSNKGDQSDMTLTRAFDLSGVSGPVEMSFKLWYDLETDYDYAFVEVSTDGQRWQIIDTPSCTTNNPSGNSYGCGYNGKSGGWQDETVDLSAYAGQQVQVRFEYVTDPVLNGEGLMIDDMRVDAVNYSSDFESDGGGWEAAGFVRVQNALPQTYIITLIERGSKTTVRTVELTPDQTGSADLAINLGQDAVLVVSGSARFTRQPAQYRFYFEQK